MNAPIFFESAGDERGTPQALFDTLDAIYHFDLDAAASAENHKCELYFGKGGVEEDALAADWGGSKVFLNPPYSSAGAFIAKARAEANKGATVVMVLPVRSDTQYWHQYIWHTDRKTWRDGVECSFLPGRLTFTLTVSPELREWIKAEFASQDPKNDTDAKWVLKGLVDVTGLPKMAVERILQNLPDEKLLEGAPFPSCVIVFTKSESTPVQEPHVRTRRSSGKAKHRTI